MKKRVMAILLTAVMIFSLSATAFAEEIDTSEPAEIAGTPKTEDPAEPVFCSVAEGCTLLAGHEGDCVPAPAKEADEESPVNAAYAVKEAGAANGPAVAKAGETEYPTLKEAFAMAESGSEVVLLRDISGMTTGEIAVVPGGKTFTLNMDGKRITVASDFTGRPIENRGALTVTGNGIIDSSASSNGYGAIRNDGTLTIYNGRYLGNVQGDGTAIRNGIGSKLTIYDGYFAGTGAVYNVGEATIYKGEFETLACSGCETPWAYALNNRDENGVSGKMWIRPENDDDIKVHGPQGALASAGGAYVEVEGGTFYTHPCKEGHTANTFYALYVSGKEGQVATCVVNGGKFSTSGANACLYLVNTNPSDNGGNPGEAVVRINGGSFDQGTAGKLINFGDKPGGVLEVAGGEFSGSDLQSVTPYIDAASVQVAEDGKLTVRPRESSDEDVVAEVGGVYYDSLQEAVKVAQQSGATVTLLKDADWDTTANTAAVEKNLVLNLGGNTLNIVGKGIEVRNGGNLTVQNGSITANGFKANKAVISVTTGSSVTLEKITKFSTDGVALFPRGDAAKVTVVDSVIEAPNSYAVATNASTEDNHKVVIELKNSTFSGSSPVLLNVPGTLRMDNCNVTGTMHGIIVRGGTAEITNSTIIQAYPDEDAAEMANYFDNRNWGSGNMVNLAAVTIGNKHPTSYQYPSNVTITDSIIKVEGTHGDLFPCVYVYANETPDNGVELAMAENTLIGGCDPQVVYGNNANITEKSYVAKIGSNYYETLQEAVSVAPDNSTVTLLKSVDAGGVIVPEGKKFTIDLNGKIYTVNKDFAGSDGTKNQCFQLLKNSDVTIQNGTIQSDKAYILIQNYCDLTLENVTLKGGAETAYGLSCNAGNTTLNNVNISGSKAGFVALDVMHWHVQYPTAPAVRVNSGNFQGEVKVYCYGDSEPHGKLTMLAIAGGTFTSPVPYEFCAPGYHPEVLGNGLYGVSNYYHTGPTGSGVVSGGVSIGTVTVTNPSLLPPQTGDNSHLTLCVVLLVVSCGGLAGTFLYSRKRKQN